MRSALIAAGLVIVSLGTPPRAPAADKLQELERMFEAQRKVLGQLHQEIQILKQERARQQVLEQEVQILKKAQQENQKLKREVEQLKVTAKPQFEAGFDKWQPYIRSTDGNFRISPVGRIQVDFRAYEDGARNLDGLAQLDFRARDIAGNRVDALTLGVNWFLGPNVKWFVNFVQNWDADVNRSPIRGEDASWEFLTRVQLWF